MYIYIEREEEKKNRKEGYIDIWIFDQPLRVVVVHVWLGEGLALDDVPVPVGDRHPDVADSSSNIIIQNLNFMFIFVDAEARSTSLLTYFTLPHLTHEVPSHTCYSLVPYYHNFCYNHPKS